MRHLLLAIAILAGAGCATDGRPAAATADDAQRLYEEGMELLDGGDYQQAITVFEQVRTRHPYSSYAALAELRTADTEFARDRFADAIALYQGFAKLHPTHELADWAAFRVAEAHREAIPSDFFIFPPPSQRDVTEADAARRAYEDFLAAFPRSEHVGAAREHLREVLRLLARHELYVGDFYASRERWLGAATRYETMLRRYPGVGYDAEATTKLVRAYEALGDEEKVRGAIERFVEKHPDAPEAAELRRRLEEAR